MDTRQYRKRPSTRLLFDISDSSIEESSTSTSGNNTSSKHYHLELRKHKNAINSELTHLCHDFNLMMLIITGLCSYTWYIIGIQWLPERNWGIEIKCNLNELDASEWTFYEKRNFSSPDFKFYKVYEPGCIYYDYNYFTYAKLTYDEASEILGKEPKPEILNCVNYTIKIDIPNEVTHIREFDIVCLKRSLQFPKFYVHLGVFAFGFPTGLLADIYGRRPVHNFCAVLCCIVSFIIPFSTNLVMFAIATSIMGGTLYACNMMLCIIFAEVFRNKCRALVLLLAFGWYFVGFGHTESIYNCAEVWRLRKLIVAVSMLAFVIGAIMVVPESPRLLATKGQFKTAWYWLHELGSTEISSDMQNYDPYKYNLKYLLKIFSKSYLLNRIYAGLLLNGAATFFYYVFKQMNRTVLLPNEVLNMQILAIQVVLLISTGIMLLFYSRKAMLCIYYILLTLSLITNSLTDSHMIADVAALSGRNFSAVIFILTIIYLIEVIPTSHRATSLGLYMTVNHFGQSIFEMFIDDLMFTSTKEFIFTLYYGVCMVCALISLMIADTTDDIPDRKEDLFSSIASETSNFNLVTSL